MELPPDLKMRNTAHGHGAKGMAFYSYEDAHGLDVMLDARRQSGRAPFVETWRYRWLPGGEFPNYVALRTAVAALTPEEIAAEKAKWPKMIEPPDESEGTSHCWLHRDRKATHHGWVQVCWHEYDGLTAMLCGECAQQASTDPAVITRASAARRAHVAELNAKQPLSERLGGAHASDGT